MPLFFVVLFQGTSTETGDIQKTLWMLKGKVLKEGPPFFAKAKHEALVRLRESNGIMLNQHWFQRVSTYWVGLALQQPSHNQNLRISALV